jgi:hypothetical protein
MAQAVAVAVEVVAMVAAEVAVDKNAHFLENLVQVVVVAPLVLVQQGVVHLTYQELTPTVVVNIVVGSFHRTLHTMVLFVSQILLTSVNHDNL